jgi:hypothetical protein
MTPFSETPQGKSLMRQVENASSNWLHVELLNVYRKARDHYEQTHTGLPGQQNGDLQTTTKENSMSIEQLIADNTAALRELAAAMNGTKASAPAAAPASAKSEPAASEEKKKPGRPPKAEPKKNVHTREEMVAVLGEVKAKFDIGAARALFMSDSVQKMADIPEADIDTVYAAAKAKLEEGDEEVAGEGEDM